MDPLSITAGVIAILELTSTLMNYLNSLKNATSEQKKFTLEACNLYSLLTSLKFRVEEARQKPENPWFNQVKLLGVENGPLDQFRECLETMAQSIPSSRKRDQIKSALMWKLTKVELENAIQRMERLKTLVNYALTDDIRTLSLAIREDVLSVHGSVDVVSGKIDKLLLHSEGLQTHAEQELTDRLKHWLDVPDPSENYNAAIKKRKHVLETGSWLIKGPQFKQWKSSASSLMWLHGKAGCGKTVLSATALHSLLQDQESQPDIVIGYFYFDFNDAKKQAAGKAVRSLMFQVAQQIPNGLVDVDKLHRECLSGQRQPTEDAVEILLQNMVKRITHTRFVIDALDECADREKLLEFITHLTNLRLGGLHILATSRREKDIEDYLHSIADYNINIQSAVVNEDIRTYVHYQMTTSELKKWSTSVRKEITTTMMNKADGMFRWVYCQLESLQHCVKLKALREALSSLPKTLDETYERILRELGTKGHLKDAITVLQWLCYSDQPLLLSELIEVLAVETGEKGKFDPEQRLPDPSDIMAICSSLITCNFDGSSDTEHDNDEDEEEGGEGSESHDNNNLDYPHSESDDSGQSYLQAAVRLAHFSVKEYLLSDSSAFKSHFNIQSCNKKMAECCLRYLLYMNEQAPLTQDIVDLHPLAQHAARCWPRYARNVPDEDAAVVKDLELQMLVCDNGALLSWMQLYNHGDGSSSDLSLTLHHLGSPLYYAAHHGLSRVVSWQTSRVDVEVDVMDPQLGTPLEAASQNGYDKVVQMLLNAGADINGPEKRYGTVLQGASLHGHGEVVQMLLDAGADVNACEGRGCGTALQAASQNGYEKVVQMLLDAGADVNVPEERGYGTALQRASLQGHGEVVQMLLDAGADVNAPEGRGWGTALQQASEGGHEKVMQMLLNAGADVNAPGGKTLSTALQRASRNGQEKIVRMLLDAGANINNCEEGHSTALQQAANEGYIKVVQMLLDAGADVNAPGNWNGTALQQASRGGHETVVQILLDAGADVNAPGNWNGTALQQASKHGHEKVVQLLLKAGAVQEDFNPA